MAIDVAELNNVKILTGLDHADLEELAAHCVPLRFLPKQLIYETGDISGDIYFIKSGILVARRFSPEGKEVHFEDFSAGDYFGHLAAISQKERLTNVETITSCYLNKLPGSVFRQLIEKNPTLCGRFLNAAVERSRVFAERIFEYSTLSVAARVRREILRLVLLQNTTSSKVTISPAPSHYDIAARTATHREAVSRELSNLNALNIIQTGRLALTVNSVSRLQQLVDEDGRAAVSQK